MGREEAIKQAILRVLEARGLTVSEAQRARVLNRHDLPTLDRWLVGAATASSTEEALR